MPDNDILNSKNLDSYDDFDLPPLPQLPPKQPDTYEEYAEPDYSNFDYSQYAAQAQEEYEQEEEGYEQSYNGEYTAEQQYAAPEAAGYQQGYAEPAEQSYAPPQEPSFPREDDFDLPPVNSVAIKKKEPEKPAPEPSIPEKDEDFEDDDYIYDGKSLDDLDAKELAGKLAPLRTQKEDASRNRREQQKMEDLTKEVGEGLVLDEMSTEYKPIEAKAESLVEKDKLDLDEKRVLKQNLAANLGQRSSNYNAALSKNLETKLLAEKELKIARKGFAVSIIPIFMCIGTAVLSFFMLSPNISWFKYAAPFMLASSLLLFVKSKGVKTLSIVLIIIYTLLLLGPGLILFAMNNSIPDNLTHIGSAAGGAVLNIIAVAILTKNEAVNTYYGYKKQ